MSKARDIARAGTALANVDATELGYLDGVTSSVQTQLNGKQAVVSGVDDTEIGYLNGVTSAIQTQLDAKAVYPSQTGNSGKYLTTNGTTTSWGTVASAPDFLAGKNKIINGDFGINQRAFSSASGSGVAQYTFDRWFATNSGGTYNPSAQTFTPGTAPVVGYESTNFLRNATSGQSASGDYSVLLQRIEDVRTLANQTATISFWAKASSGTPKIGVEISQSFGSGGSPSADVNTAVGAITISTSWARYSATIAVPSISGKTIGTTANTSHLQINFWLSAGSTLATRASSIGIQNSTIDVWGVQVEAGSVATPFTTATGNVSSELAACKRYYERRTASSTQGYAPYAAGYFNFATAGSFAYSFEREKRVQPTLTFGPSVGQFSAAYAGNGGAAATTLTAANISKFGCIITLVPSGTPFTQGQGALLVDAGSAVSYIEVSAEL